MRVVVFKVWSKLLQASVCQLFSFKKNNNFLLTISLNSLLQKTCTTLPVQQGQGFDGNLQVLQLGGDVTQRSYKNTLHTMIKLKRLQNPLAVPFCVMDGLTLGGVRNFLTVDRNQLPG